MALVLIAKNRRSKIVRRRQLEELEEALLDENPEDRALDLPVAPPEDYEDYLDEEDDYQEDKPIAEPAAGTLAQDPEFGRQIVITAQSSRKKAEPTEVEQTEPPESLEDDSSNLDIEKEFVQFAQELKQKQLQVQKRHRQEREELEDILQPAEPVPLIDPEPGEIIEEETRPAISDDDLEDLFVQSDLEDIPVADEYVTEPDPELQGIAEEFELQTPARGPKERKQQLILKLEEFQRDLEHQFQSRNLSRLAQQNFELVESMNNSESARHHHKTKQQHTLSTLESLAFGLGNERR